MSDLRRPMKIEDAGIAFGGRNQAPVIMEVIGKDGQKVAEYVDKEDLKVQPYVKVLG